jgi:hypothetical protein
MPMALPLRLRSVLPSNKTDANGQIDLQVSWGKNYATWLAYTVRATTYTIGTEGSTVRRFMTSASEDDKDTGTFRTPPYGTGKCNASN